MTDLRARLSEIKARCNRATRGPWTNPRGGQYVLMPEWRQHSHMNTPEDATFVCAARADMPYLVAECEALLERIETLKALVRPRCSQCGQEWSATACGPTHAVCANAIDPIAERAAP